MNKFHLLWLLLLSGHLNGMVRQLARFRVPALHTLQRRGLRNQTPMLASDLVDALIKKSTVYADLEKENEKIMSETRDIFFYSWPCIIGGTIAVMPKVVHYIPSGATTGLAGIGVSALAYGTYLRYKRKKFVEKHTLLNNEQVATLDDIRVLSDALVRINPTDERIRDKISDLRDSCIVNRSRAQESLKLLITTRPYKG